MYQLSSDPIRRKLYWIYVEYVLLEYWLHYDYDVVDDWDSYAPNCFD